MKYKLEEKDPKCHDLYVKWALEHINTAVDALDLFDAYSNINVLDMTCPFVDAIHKKIYTNSAYFEAFEILLKLQPDKFARLRLDEYHQVYV